MSETTPSGRPLVPGTASWLQRVGAIVVDWLACYLVAYFILQDVNHPAFGALVPLLFLLETGIGIALTGASLGHKVLRLTVHELNGRPLPLLKAFLRQLLVLLVIPPLVFLADGRGLHDIWTNSAVFARRPAPGTT